MKKLAYNVGLEIRHAIVRADADLIQHIPEVDEILERRFMEVRRQALEAAAKVAERYGRHLHRGETGLEYVDGNCVVAAAIRALAGKEGE